MSTIIANPLFNKKKRFSPELLRKLHVRGGAQLRHSLERDWKVPQDAPGIAIVLECDTESGNIVGSRWSATGVLKATVKIKAKKLWANTPNGSTSLEFPVPELSNFVFPNKGPHRNISHWLGHHLIEELVEVKVQDSTEKYHRQIQRPSWSLYLNMGRGLLCDCALFLWRWEQWGYSYASLRWEQNT